MKLNVNKDINDHDVPPDGEISMFQTMWYIGKIDSNGTLQRLSNSELLVQMYRISMEMYILKKEKLKQ